MNQIKLSRFYLCDESKDFNTGNIIHNSGSQSDSVVLVNRPLIVEKAEV